METEYDARFREWGEDYEDFEADDVRDLIVRAGDASPPSVSTKRR